jgi:hypothetical protein
VVISGVLELIEQVTIVELVLMLVIVVEVSVLHHVLWLVVHILVLALPHVPLFIELSVSLVKLTLSKLKISQKLLILVYVIKLRIIVDSVVKSHVVLLSEIVVWHPIYVTILIELLLLLSVLIIIKHLLLVELVVHLWLMVEVLLHICVKLLLGVHILKSAKSYRIIIVLVNTRCHHLRSRWLTILLHIHVLILIVRVIEYRLEISLL